MGDKPGRVTKKAAPKRPVFDLDALEVEADGEPFPFSFGGEDFVLPPHIDMRAVAALDGGRLDDALRLLIGAEQWERLQAVDKVFDERHLGALFEAYGAHVGSSLGESLASTGSSNRAGRRSRPTSSGTTKLR